MSSLADKVKERLSQLDFEPRLEIEQFSFHPSIQRKVMLVDGKTSPPKNPTTYIINQAQITDFGIVSGILSEDVFAVMLAARHVRRRAQIMGKVSESFIDIFISKEFFIYADNIIFTSSDNWEADSEIVARIAASMFKKGDSIEKIREILVTDASIILNDLGKGFIEKSILGLLI